MISMRIRLQRVLLIRQHVPNPRSLLGAATTIWIFLLDSVVDEIASLGRALGFYWVTELVQVDQPSQTTRHIMAIQFFWRSISDCELTLAGNEDGRGLEADVGLAPTYIFASCVWILEGLFGFGSRAGSVHIHPRIWTRNLLLMSKFLTELTELGLNFQVQREDVFLILLKLILVQPIMDPPEITYLLRLIIPQRTATQIGTLLVLILVITLLVWGSDFLAWKELQSIRFYIFAGAGGGAGVFDWTDV